jgi:hypothetical protein
VAASATVVNGAVSGVCRRATLARIAAQPRTRRTAADARGAPGQRRNSVSQKKWRVRVPANVRRLPPRPCASRCSCVMQHSRCGVWVCCLGLLTCRVGCDQPPCRRIPRISLACTAAPALTCSTSTCTRRLSMHRVGVPSPVLSHVAVARIPRSVCPPGWAATMSVACTTFANLDRIVV